MSGHAKMNRNYSIELADKCINDVYGRSVDEGTKGIQSVLAEIIFTGLQIAESRGRVTANLPKSTTDDPQPNPTEGIELIKKERLEQIEKHGFDQNHDRDNDCEELQYAALYLLVISDPNHSPQVANSFFPDYWDQEWKAKFKKKGTIEKLVIAGALIAAEIDRIQR